MEDHTPPTLEYRPPEARWTTRRWIWVWLPMSVAFLAIALSAIMFVRYRAAEERLAAMRALQAAQAAQQAALNAWLQAQVPVPATTVPATQSTK